VVPIAGPGHAVTLNTTQTISGNKTFSGTVALGASATATTPATNDNSTALATTAWVKLQGYGSGSGSLTSVGLALSTEANAFLSVADSPLITNGNITLDLDSQTANHVFAAPNGSAGKPSFRALVAGDIPSLSTLYLPLSGGTLTGGLTVGGDLVVNGTTTTINSTVLDVDDINITLGTVGSPTDSTANTGGITLKGASDKLFRWLSSTAAWTSSEHIDLATGKAYYINGTSVLSATALGSAVTSSSLTSVGTLTTGTWNATTIGVAYGGTGVTTLTGIVKGNGTGAFSAAVAGTDYLNNDSVIDCGTF
jgi:hypothetical protein